MILLKLFFYSIITFVYFLTSFSSGQVAGFFVAEKMVNEFNNGLPFSYYYENYDVDNLYTNTFFYRDGDKDMAIVNYNYDDNSVTDYEALFIIDDYYFEYNQETDELVQIDDDYYKNLNYFNSYYNSAENDLEKYGTVFFNNYYDDIDFYKDDYYYYADYYGENENVFVELSKDADYLCVYDELIYKEFVFDFEDACNLSDFLKEFDKEWLYDYVFEYYESDYDEDDYYENSDIQELSF